MKYYNLTMVLKKTHCCASWWRV